MHKQARSAIAAGTILVALGVLLLVARLVPGFWGELTWPFIVIGAGVLMLVLAIATGNAGLAVPACIVGGIGLLLYWQNANDRWETWAYAWALIPGFAGVGTLLLGLITRDGKAVGGGLWLVVISLVLFAIFGSFLGGPELLGAYWPVLLILLGLWLFGRAIFRRRA